MSVDEHLEATLAASRGWRGVSLRAVLLSSIVLVVLATLTLASISVLRLMRTTAERERQAVAELLVETLAYSTLDDLEPLAATWVTRGSARWIAIVEPAAAEHGGEARLGPVDEHVALDMARTAAEVQDVASGIASMPRPRSAVAALRLPGNERPRVLVLALSMEGTDKQLAGAQGLVLLYLVLVGLVVAVFGYILVTRSVVRPLRTLVRATTQVASGDLDTRVRTGGVGEIAQLADQFNQMVSNVRRARETREVSLRQLGTANAELEQANRRLRAARDELVRAERLASVGRLAAGVAHEIGNPLASVLAYLELMGEADADPGLNAELVPRAKDATRRIQRIIRELLDYSRADTAEIGPAPVSLAIAQAVDLVAPQPRLRGLTLTKAIATDLPLALLDEPKLVQLLVNLILNAADALCDHAQGGTITVSADRHDDGVVVCVHDDGPGIPHNVLPRVFDPFFTTKAPGAGTGLGLAMCERLAEQMGAAISVVSVAGDTTFKVVLSTGPSAEMPEPPPGVVG